MTLHVYRSEIRDSTINELFEKVQKKNIGKYLYQIKLSKIRGFENSEIQFDFPVTAIIGRNGGGKTTILGAAACLYESIRPRQFFAKSGSLDSSMQGWRIDYQAIDKSVNRTEIIKKSASFTSTKWYRDTLKRNVSVFGVIRTLPANERSEMRKLVSNSLEFKSEDIENLADAVKAAVGNILGKDVTGFNHIKIDKSGKISLLSGITTAGKTYSEFHFGAGESSIIRMVMQLEAAEANSLVLIEEIENGLHPLATVKMVEYLIDLADRKGIQSIFTTHSNDALRVLPSKAIWAVENGTLKQGKLDVALLRSISGNIDSELAIFCEDQFAKNWIESVIRRQHPVRGDSIGVYNIGGDSKAVSTHKAHLSNPTTPLPSLCYLDGDAQEQEDAAGGIFKLPGQAPETYIYDKVKDEIAKQKARLAVAMHLSTSDQDLVEREVNSIRLSNRDHHLLFRQLGDKLGFISETVVIGAFISVWIDTYPTEAEKIFEPINIALEKIESSKTASEE